MILNPWIQGHLLQVPENYFANRGYSSQMYLLSMSRILTETLQVDFCLGKLGFRRCYKYNFGQTRCSLNNLICVSLQYNMVPIPWPSMGDFVSSQNANGRWWLYSVSALAFLVAAAWVILWLLDTYFKRQTYPTIVTPTYVKLRVCLFLFNCFTWIYLIIQEPKQ